MATEPFLPAHPGIRPATAQDIPVLLDIINGAYRNDAGWTTESHLVEGARALAPDLEKLITPLRDPSTGTFLVYHPTTSNDPLGCINAEILPGNEGYFGMFAVNQSQQGLGIGRKLMEASFEVMRIKGCKKCVINVLTDRKDIQAWYGRCGFVMTGKTVPFPVDAGASKLKPGVQPVLVYMEREL
ncbi:hypothetical protein SpCBS45565_g04087 [Spizellomyces sp. 'palustris']|nr:hypothetical protein SpCBS45565_g04087 [Spizellomyces sp. 'palustris']